MDALISIIIIIVVVVIFIGLLYWLLFKNKDKNINGGANVFFKTIYRKDRDIIIQLLEENIPKHIFYNDVEYTMYDLIALLKDSPITLYLVVRVSGKYANFYFYEDIFEARNQKDILYKAYDINNTKIDRYSMMIISKYLNSINDYKNIEESTKEYKGIRKQFRYNPITLDQEENTKKIFKNSETYYIYGRDDDPIKSIDNMIDTYNKIICFADIYYDEYKDLLKKHGDKLMKVTFKSVIFNRQSVIKILNRNWINDILEFTIPNDSNISLILNKCFIHCTNLTSINIPSNVISIGDQCFYSCYNLTSISIPSSVTSIGDECFNYCTNLTSINIPSSVISIGDACFENCKNLTTINIPSSVTSIGNACFRYCNNLTLINIPSSVTNISDECFLECTNLTSINIPSSVIRIGNVCFLNCSNLTSINIPSSVTSIGDECFANCENLITINIPSSVIRIGDYCFENCTNLQHITIDENNPIYRVDENNEIVKK